MYLILQIPILFLFSILCPFKRWEETKKRRKKNPFKKNMYIA